MKKKHLVSALAALAALFLAVSCGKEDKVSFDKELFNEALQDLNKAVTGEDLEELRQMAGDPIAPAARSNRPEFDIEKWNKFVKLCEKEQYSKALELFGADADKGDFIFCMPSNDLLYCFHAAIIHPLLNEFKEKEQASNSYISLLLFDLSIEESLQKKSDSTKVRVSEYYPTMITDLGLTMADAGQYDEALNLAGKLEEAMDSASGSHAMALFSKGTYLSHIYMLKGDKDAALQALEDTRIFLTRQEWGELSDQESAMVVSCLKSLEDAKSQLMLE